MRMKNFERSICTPMAARKLVAIVVLALGIAAAHPLENSVAAASGPIAEGAGKTIIEGGTGGSTPIPVTTTVAFHATSHSGDFECLAFVPPSASGPGSGDFSVNAMYVTGNVTSLQVEGNTAILRGTATVTGLGAGTNLPFEARVVGGGPGTTIVLVVSGLTFHEILIDGQLTVQ